MSFIGCGSGTLADRIIANCRAHEKWAKKMIPGYELMCEPANDFEEFVDHKMIDWKPPKKESALDRCCIQNKAQRR